MKIKNTIWAAFTLLLGACALDEPEVKVQDENFPFRLLIDEEGADLADTEDYGIEISFADYLGELPANAITLTYELSGEGDFAGATIDEIIYEYEDDDCVFVREVAFTENTITIPVDTDLGTVPEAIEIVVLMNESGEFATDSEFTLEITDLSSPDNVLFSDANAFTYEILDNDLAGAWVLQLRNEAEFVSFQEVMGTISTDLSALSFDEITGDVKLEFEFEEMKIEIELKEEEEVTECEDGEVETEIENLVIEIEADYDAEDGELELEGSYFNEDDEELDFIIEAEYELMRGRSTIIISTIIDEDQFETGDELFSGTLSFPINED